MKTVSQNIEDKIHKLLACLAKDIIHLEKCISYLDELRSLVIKRDTAALNRQLEEIHAESQDYKENESNRQRIRNELAQLFVLPPEKMTLSVLADSLPVTTRENILRCKSTLQALALRYRKEYLNTSMLLSECSRLNNLILQTLLGTDISGTAYYNSKGITKRNNENTLVNMQI